MPSYYHFLPQQYRIRSHLHETEMENAQTGLDSSRLLDQADYVLTGIAGQIDLRPVSAALSALE